jgi:hypothetical protein
MTDPGDKAALQDLAAYWRRMGEQAERNDSRQNENK